MDRHGAGPPVGTWERRPPVNEIANWAMLLVGQIKPALDRLDLRRFRSEDGKELVDLPLLLRPPADTAAPVRFLSTWEEDRSRIFSTRTPFSFNTFLVDGEVAGTWRHVSERISLDPWRPLSRRASEEAEHEAHRLAEWYA